eukprot:12004429-Alexandrium_andersonii.AAC.1
MCIRDSFEECRCSIKTALVPDGRLAAWTAAMHLSPFFRPTWWYPSGPTSGSSHRRERLKSHRRKFGSASSFDE